MQLKPDILSLLGLHCTALSPGLFLPFLFNQFTRNSLCFDVQLEEV